MADVRIRLADEREGDSISRVLYESFLEFKAFYTAEGFAATTPSSQEIQQRFNEGPIWVAIQKDRIVGTVSCVQEGRSLYVRSMGVHPAARGKGIALALLREVELFATSNEYESMRLSTTPFLTAAISVYERFGFLRTQDGPHDLHGTPLFSMIKKLRKDEAR